MNLVRLFKTSLCLPPGLRPILALPPPRARLLAGLDELRSLRYSNIISVGDRVTRDLVNSGVYPWIAVYDCIERRGKSVCPKLPGYEKRVVRNPRSTISSEAATALYEATRSNKRVAIHVLGEEDLLALIAVLASPIGGHVIYGLPSLAAVDIVVDADHKRTVAMILSMFTKCS